MSDSALSSTATEATTSKGAGTIDLAGFSGSVDVVVAGSGAAAVDFEATAGSDAGAGVLAAGGVLELPEEGAAGAAEIATIAAAAGVLGMRGLAAVGEIDFG